MPWSPWPGPSASILTDWNNCLSFAFVVYFFTKGRAGAVKDYSVARMRKECQSIYRLLLGEAVVLLIVSAVFGALWKVLDHGERQKPLTILGVFAALLLLLLGLYLLTSDPKWMLRHTLYGKTLMKLGEPEKLIQAIDLEAQSMDYECAAFALMAHWLVLYQCALPGNNRIQSRPIPSRHISRISWGKDREEENAGFWVRFVTTEGDEWEAFVWEIADIDALRQWGAIQEKKER